MLGAAWNIPRLISFSINHSLAVLMRSGRRAAVHASSPPSPVDSLAVVSARGGVEHPVAAAKPVGELTVLMAKPLGVPTDEMPKPVGMALVTAKPIGVLIMAVPEPVGETRAAAKPLGALRQRRPSL